MDHVTTGLLSTYRVFTYKEPGLQGQVFSIVFCDGVNNCDCHLTGYCGRSQN